MRKQRIGVCAAFFLTAMTAAAQVEVGVLPNVLNSSDANFPTPQTDVSLENPATGAGTINTVNFGWNATCSGVAKIKFFRRSGNTLTLIAERGPFSTSGASTVQGVVLSPAVNVLQGDLIGITRVASCGNALAEAGSGTLGYVVLQGDATGGTISAGNTFHDRLGLIGVGSAPVDAVTGYLAVVGSAPGSGGSNFKTALQLFNPTDQRVNGRLIFHRQFAIGSQNDPSLTFSLAPGEVFSYTDFVATMNISGLGSVDLISVAGSAPPVMLTRIYNDAGAQGTAGFFEDLIPTTSGVGTHILTNGTQAVLLTPIEPARTRMNFGVRTLSSGATMTVRVENSAGQVVSTAPKILDPNYFQQFDSNSFLTLNGAPLPADHKVRIIMTGGSAIVYAATTDNVTNDPAVTFATAIPMP